MLDAVYAAQEDEVMTYGRTTSTAPEEAAMCWLLQSCRQAGRQEQQWPPQEEYSASWDVACSDPPTTVEPTTTTVDDTTSADYQPAGYRSPHSQDTSLTTLAIEKRV